MHVSLIGLGKEHTNTCSKKDSTFLKCTVTAQSQDTSCF